MSLKNAMARKRMALDENRDAAARLGLQLGSCFANGVGLADLPEKLSRLSVDRDKIVAEMMVIDKACR